MSLILIFLSRPWGSKIEALSPDLDLNTTRGYPQIILVPYVFISEFGTVLQRMAVLRILDPHFFYPGSEFFPSWIPDPNFFHPGSRIRIKEFKYFNPKNWFLSSGKYSKGCSSRIRILTFYTVSDPDSGSRGQKGTEFRIRNTGKWYCSVRIDSFTLKDPDPNPYQSTTKS
jgi:hypothetical protein